MPGISVGVAQAGDQAWPGANELIGAADRAMYTAKNSGGSQVMVTKPPMALEAPCPAPGVERSPPL